MPVILEKKSEKTSDKKSEKKTAKVFMNGRSQAVRLPKAFRFDCDEVYIRRDDKTGDVILSTKPDSWDDFFELLEELGPAEDLWSDLPKDFPPERDLF